MSNHRLIYYKVQLSGSQAHDRIGPVYPAGGCRERRVHTHHSRRKSAKSFNVGCPDINHENKVQVGSPEPHSLNPEDPKP